MTHLLDPLRSVRLSFNEGPVHENMKTGRELSNYAENVIFRYSDFKPEVLDINWYTIHKYFYIKKGKVFPLKVRCGSEGGKSYSSSLP